MSIHLTQSGPRAIGSAKPGFECRCGAFGAALQARQACPSDKPFVCVGLCTLVFAGTELIRSPLQAGAGLRSCRSRKRLHPELPKDLI